MTVLAILVLVAIPLVVAAILGVDDERCRWWEPAVAVEMLKWMAMLAGVLAVVGTLALAAGWAINVLCGGGK